MHAWIAALAVVAACAAVVAGPGEASASPAMPRPLERKVRDAEVVVVAKLRTRPEHPGDVFEADVVETLKGAPGAGPVRVSAAYFFTGCVPPPEGTPLPKAIEGGAQEALLFLGAPEDGVRPSSDPVVLDPPGRASAWFYDDRDAALAPDAVRALVALDAETDAVRAGDLWAAGLASPNALLVTALLHRLDFVVSSQDGAAWNLGEDLGARARRDWTANRAKLLPATAACAARDDVVIRMLVFNVVRSTLPAQDDAERSRLDAVASAARAAATGDVLAARSAFALLGAIRDPDVVTLYVAALRAHAADAQKQQAAALAGEVLRPRPEMRDAFVAAVLPLLDEDGTTDVAVRALDRVVSECRDAAGWRAWARERAK